MTLEELEKKFTPEERFSIRFLYTLELKSQREIARMLRLPRMYVALWLKLSGLSRADGQATAQAKKTKRHRQNIGFAVGAHSKKDGRKFVRDLQETVELRKKDRES